MLDGNTKAEIARDTDTEYLESARFLAEEARWIRTLNDLLEGKTIEGMNLADRMADQYEEFTDYVNMDFDFMKAYIEGSFCEKVNDLFRSEAKTLASIIVG
jgi:hypothetical protein